MCRPRLCPDLINFRIREVREEGAGLRPMPGRHQPRRQAGRGPTCSFVSASYDVPRGAFTLFTSLLPHFICFDCVIIEIVIIVVQEPPDDVPDHNLVCEYITAVYRVRTGNASCCSRTPLHVLCKFLLSLRLHFFTPAPPFCTCRHCLAFTISTYF